MAGSWATAWWVLAGVLVAVELVTGTFYLLMLAVGAVAAALAAHLGLGSEAQITAAAVAGGAATVAWHLKRRGSNKAGMLPADRNRDVNMDVGEQVSVEAWSADGTTTVRHRGAVWQARLSPGTAVASAATGPHKVVSVQGNYLVLQALS